LIALLVNSLTTVEHVTIQELVNNKTTSDLTLEANVTSVFTQRQLLLQDQAANAMNM
jgi:hypothetical protein